MTFRILSVCTGNICRSPVAELILASELAGIPDVTVHSAGVGALVGHGVPDPAQALASTRGIDAGEHRARQVDEGMLREADLLLGMARDHRRQIVETVPASMRRAFTLRELARISDFVARDLPQAVADSGAHTVEDALRAAIALATTMRGAIEPPASPDDLDIVDPYRRSDETYRRSFEQLAPAAERVARYLRSAAQLVPHG